MVSTVVMDRCFLSSLSYYLLSRIRVRRLMSAIKAILLVAKPGPLLVWDLRCAGIHFSE
jgi:hypothetical protein